MAIAERPQTVTTAPKWLGLRAIRKRFRDWWGRPGTWSTIDPIEAGSLELLKDLSEHASDETRDPRERFTAT